ncbi:MAG: MFS transporter [Desulfarculus sp.]|nr:MFS transporter [Desulfarculus sp.]
MSGPAPHGAAPPRLYTRQFVAQMAIQFLLFCNMAVFFHYFAFLTGMGLDKHQAGLLVGAFALVGLVVRPLLSPVIGVNRAWLWLFWGALANALALAAYNLPAGFNAWLGVRLLHGLAYAVLAIAGTAAMVACIPPDRSGEAFGVMGIITLLPYAVVPPLVEPLERCLGGYLNLLNLTGLVTLGILPLTWLGRPSRAAVQGVQGKGPLKLGQLRENLRDRGVVGCLLLSLGVYSAFACLFFLAEPAFLERGLQRAGWFFTSTYCAEMLVRLLAAKRLDRHDKRRLLAGGAAWLVLCFVLTSLVAQDWQAVAVGFAFGLGWGVAFPLLNALLFELSPPHLRALNLNLGMFMFQGGFFLGPWLGGLLLAGFGGGVLFLASAGVCLAVGLAALNLKRQEKLEEQA